MRNPPILISVLGFFTLIAAFYWIYIGLRLLGFDWFGALGDLPAFEQTGLWGWLALIAGAAFLAAGVGLWALQDWAWMFAIIVAGFALFEAFLWFIEAPGLGRRLQRRDHAPADHLVPEHRRGQGRVRQERAAVGQLTDPRHHLGGWPWTRLRRSRPAAFVRGDPGQAVASCETAARSRIRMPLPNGSRMPMSTP